MSRRRSFLLSALLFLATVLSGPTAAASPQDESNAPPDTLTSEALVKELRQGGLVLYIRHGRTDLSTRDEDRSDLSRCDRQRQLSEEGRTELKQIAAHVRTIGLRVDRVLASPYCRAMETARLAFGRVEAEPALTHTIDADKKTARARAAALTKLLSTPPAAGTHTVLAGHTGNLMEASGLWPSPEGATLVFRSEADGRFSFVARIAPQRWAELAKLARSLP